MSDGLEGLMNFGPKTRQWLRVIGIHSVEEFHQTDIFDMFEKLKVAGYPVNKVFLYAAQGAKIGAHWRYLPKETRDWIEKEYSRRFPKEHK